MFKSMTPEQLLAKHNYAVVRVDKNGEFLWYSNSYPLEGSALSDVEENNQYISNGDRYVVVTIDHTTGCDGECVDMEEELASANAALNATREEIAGIEDMMDNLRAEYNRLTVDNDRYDTALTVVMKAIAHECELICKAHTDDGRYMTKYERHVRKLDRKRYETLSRINSLIDAATCGEYGEILPQFPNLS